MRSFDDFGSFGRRFNMENCDERLFRTNDEKARLERVGAREGRSGSVDRLWERRPDSESIDDDLSSILIPFGKRNDVLDAESEKGDREQFDRIRRLADDVARRSGRRAQRFSNANFADSRRERNLDMNDRDDVSAAFRLDSPPDATVTIGGRSYVYFCGDGYLGLQADPELISVACSAALKYGLTSASSRDLFTSAPVQSLERSAARFFDASAALCALDEATLADLFLLTLNNSFERAFVDELSESFWKSRFQRLNGLARSKGASSAIKELIPFRHCDSRDLKEKLERELQLDERPLLLTDGVFSNWGTVAPLKEYDEILSKFGESSVIVDDSHGLGVLGNSGRGTIEHWELDFSRVNQTGGEIRFAPQEAPTFGEASVGLFGESSSDDQESRASNVERPRLYMFASLNNAAGGFGCVAAGSELFVDQLRECEQSNRSVPPNSIAAASARGIDMLAKSQDRRARARENADYLRAGMRRLGISVQDSPTPIVAFQIGSIGNMKRIRQELERDRVLVSFLPYRFNNSRGALRAAVFSTHTREALDMFLDSLQRALS